LEELSDEEVAIVLGPTKAVATSNGTCLVSI